MQSKEKNVEYAKPEIIDLEKKFTQEELEKYQKCADDNTKCVQPLLKESNKIKELFKVLGVERTQEMLAMREARLKEQEKQERKVGKSVIPSLLNSINDKSRRGSRQRSSINNSFLISNSIDAYKDNNIFHLPRNLNTSNMDLDIKDNSQINLGNSNISTNENTKNKLQKHCKCGSILNTQPQKSSLIQMKNYVKNIFDLLGVKKELKDKSNKPYVLPVINLQKILEKLIREDNLQNERKHKK